MKSELRKSTFLLIIDKQPEASTEHEQPRQDCSCAAAGAGKVTLFRLMRQSRMKARVPAERVLNAQLYLLLSPFPPALQLQVNFSLCSLFASLRGLLTFSESRPAAIDYLL